MILIDAPITIIEIVIDAPITIQEPTINAPITHVVNDFGGTIYMGGGPFPAWLIPCLAENGIVSEIVQDALEELSLEAISLASIVSLNSTHRITTTAITTKTNAYGIVSTDSTILLKGTSNLVEATLPLASANTGKKIYIKCIDDTFPCTVKTIGTDTLDDASTMELMLHETITIQSDGTNWWII